MIINKGDNKMNYEIDIKPDFDICVHRRRRGSAQARGQPVQDPTRQAAQDRTVLGSSE